MRKCTGYDFVAGVVIAVAVLTVWCPEFLHAQLNCTENAMCVQIRFIMGGAGGKNTCCYIRNAAGVDQGRAYNHTYAHPQMWGRESKGGQPKVESYDGWFYESNFTKDCPDRGPPQSGHNVSMWMQKHNEVYQRTCVQPGQGWRALWAIWADWRPG